MKLWYDKSNDGSVTPSVATIGFFDGVHRGHRCLIEQVCTLAEKHGLAASVVTFPGHPRKVMQPDFCPHLLTTCHEKLQLLEKTGLNGCIILPFTSALAALGAREFMQWLSVRYAVRMLVVGYDHHFGHNRSEGYNDYVRYGRELGMEVVQALPLATDEGVQQVSSSRIRRLLLEGNAEEAANLLGYRYFLKGTVEGGQHVGRTLGFPTANLRLEDPEKLVPADGVYAVQARTENGTECGGMLSIGTRPTLGKDSQRTIEVHLFDFRGDLYRHSLRVELLRYVRPNRCFDTLEGLRQQLLQDEQNIRAILTTPGIR